jgi:hypothetical protein
MELGGPQPMRPVCLQLAGTGIGLCQLRPAADMARREPRIEILGAPRCACVAQTLAPMATLPPKGMPAAPNNRAPCTADHLHSVPSVMVGVHEGRSITVFPRRDTMVSGSARRRPCMPPV